MAMKIVQTGEPVLRELARPLSKTQIQSREIQTLIESLREAMYEAPGVGLAAPQVGIGIQLAVIEDKPDYTRDVEPEYLAERERKPVPFHVIINPRLSMEGPANVEFFEGCLSLPGFTACVARARKVKVDCLDHHGEAKVIEASGWYARILQHEIDHLAGTLYIDRMYTRSFMNLDNFTRFWKNKSRAEIKALIKRKP
jgi:peptide deformylase